LDEEVALQDRALWTSPAEGHGPAVGGPKPGVAEDEARDPLGIGGRDREADWPAPVVAHHDQLLEVELPHQLADHPGMLGRRVAVPGRPVGETEAEIVDGDTAEGALQRSDQLPVQKSPGRVAVTHQDRRAPASST